MITINSLICILGLILWAIFSKWPKVADGFLAEVGRIMFFAGLLAWLFAVGAKTAV